MLLGSEYMFALAGLFNAAFKLVARGRVPLPGLNVKSYCVIEHSRFTLSAMSVSLAILVDCFRHQVLINNPRPTKSWQLQLDLLASGVIL